MKIIVIIIKLNGSHDNEEFIMLRKIGMLINNLYFNDEIM